MNAKNAAEAADFGTVEPQAGTDKAARVPLHLGREARVRLYRTVAGILAAGLDVETALEIVEGEYLSAAGSGESARARAEAEVAARFLSGLARIRKASDGAALGPEMPDLVGKLLGRDFVEAEEMAVLRAMKTATDLGAAFRAAADLALMGRRRA